MAARCSPCDTTHPESPAEGAPLADTTSVLTLTPAGLYCPPGDFHIDPWQPVDRAVITHAHGDHLRGGSRHYLLAAPGVALARLRLPADASIEAIAYGAVQQRHGVSLSLHPAGHILGSAQVRIEYHGEVWVVSGDYKLEPDRTCAPFELVRCHGFITESTFGLPIYRWASQDAIMTEINQWWRQNQARGRATLLLGYSLGKAQRLLAGLDPTIGPIATHGAVETMTALYRSAGVALPTTTAVGTLPAKQDWSRHLIIAPPGSEASPWRRRFGDCATGFASGWMQVRGARRRRALDRGFPLSDHADWPGLLDTIQATGAHTVWATHGFTGSVVRYLEERGHSALAISTRFAIEPTEPEEL